MRRTLLVLFARAAVVAVAFDVLTMPRAIEVSALPTHSPDLANGKYMFTAGGCAECHAAPLKACDDRKTKNKELLAGGRCLKTPFGTFNVPNISPDKETGIGAWSTLDFINAMKLGMAPEGEHLYPAFPYTSYQRMSFEDLSDLKAYLGSLPAVKSEVPEHDLAFPFNIRRGPLAEALRRREELRCRSWGERRRQSRRLSRAGARTLPGVPLAAQHHRRHHRRRGFCRGEKSGREGDRSQHHTEQRRHRRLERAGYRLFPRDREYPGLRHGRGQHGRGAIEHGEAQARGPRRDCRLSEIAIAEARRRAEIRAEIR